MSSNLTAAILQVMEAVPYVKPTGYNNFAKYAYASEDDLLSALKPAMAAAGLCILPVKCEPVGQRTQGKNAIQVLRMTFRLMHTSGECVDLECMGEGADTLDKASYKAMTGALKQALRQSFMIVTGLDAEKTQRAQQSAQGGPPTQAPDLTRQVMPGKRQRWLDLGPEHLEWIRSAASGMLTSDNPDQQTLYHDQGWQRYAAARLAQLEAR